MVPGSIFGGSTYPKRDGKVGLRHPNAGGTVKFPHSTKLQKLE